MVDDVPPAVSVAVERELEISPGPAPPGTSQAEWEDYCYDAVLAWRERAFLPVDIRQILKRSSTGPQESPTNRLGGSPA
jgi:hypothetical protein